MNLSPAEVVGFDKIIAHRGYCREDRAAENSISSLLQGLHSCAGIETDLRYSRDRGLYIGHDHYQDSSAPPPTLHEFTKAIHNLQDIAHADVSKYLFMNIKEDGLLHHLDPQIMSSLEDSGVKVYFFDMSIPEMVRYSKRFPSRVAIRISVMEPSSWAGMLQQLLCISPPVFWIDTFSGLTEELKQEIDILSTLYPESELIIVDPQIHGQSAIDSRFLLEKKQIYLMADV